MMKRRGEGSYLVTIVLMLSLNELGLTTNQNRTLTMFTAQIAYE